ncbi:hypothetical protein [Actinopolymorpha alba]|nr:hypothetical protein [Actinopolymorpha alba]
MALLVALVLGWVVPFGVYAWLGPRVSYRWFDCLILLIPISGVIWS